MPTNAANLKGTLLGFLDGKVAHDVNSGKDEEQSGTIYLFFFVNF